MSEIITGQQAKELFKDFSEYQKAKFCSCGINVDIFNVVAAETEKEINGADVLTLEFFCSTQCANEWLEVIETKKQSA